MDTDMKIEITLAELLEYESLREKLEVLRARVREREPLRVDPWLPGWPGVVPSYPGTYKVTCGPSVRVGDAIVTVWDAFGPLYRAACRS